MIDFPIAAVFDERLERTREHVPNNIVNKRFDTISLSVLYCSGVVEARKA